MRFKGGEELRARLAVHQSPEPPKLDTFQRMLTPEESVRRDRGDPSVSRVIVGKALKYPYLWQGEGVQGIDQTSRNGVPRVPSARSVPRSATPIWKAGGRSGERTSSRHMTPLSVYPEMRVALRGAPPQNNTDSGREWGDPEYHGVENASRYARYIASGQQRVRMKDRPVSYRTKQTPSQDLVYGHGGNWGSYGLRWAGEITKSSLNWHRNNIAAAQLASARRPVSAVPVRQSRADPQAGCRLRPSSSRLPGRGGLLGTPLTLGDY